MEPIPTPCAIKGLRSLPIIRGGSTVGTDSVRNLGPSESSNESIILTAPLTAGTYYYGACVDSVSGEKQHLENNCSDNRECQGNC